MDVLEIIGQITDVFGCVCVLCFVTFVTIACYQKAQDWINE